MMKRLFLGVVAFTLATSADAVTNEEFAQQVVKHVRIFERDAAALREAEKFCTSLPDQRRQNEVRCVAMQKVTSKELRKGGFEKSSGRRW